MMNNFSAYLLYFTGILFLTRTIAFSPQLGVKLAPVKIISSSTSSHVKLGLSSQEPSAVEEKTAFPVLSRIAGVEWNGECRYAGPDLRQVKNLKLVGGLRYDIDGATCKLASFLTFPNGQTREVVMQGKRENSSTLRLYSTAPDGGPIYMVLTELAPDTVLINEVEKLSGKIIMTSSLSVINDGKELVQISHEVGDGKVSIEGHQVWRLKKIPIEYDDFTMRDTTGR